MRQFVGTSSDVTGMEEFASVVSVVCKLDGIDGLRAAIQRAGDASPLRRAPASGILV
jgi:hypothetical protein